MPDVAPRLDDALNRRAVDRGELVFFHRARSFFNARRERELGKGIG
jgi:hypothetical protein